MLRNLSLGFTAGGVGGAINAAFLYAVVAFGISAALGLGGLAFDYPQFLYKQVVWGGIWGLAFALPILAGSSWVVRGLVIGFVSSLVLFFVVFPSIPDGPGVAGLGLGNMMPVLVLVANSIWGLVAAKWYEVTV